MRSVGAWRCALVVALAIASARCSDEPTPPADMAAPLDLATPDLACWPYPDRCKPECPKSLGPCFGSVGSSCGTCTQVNERCYFGEPIVECFCDHLWHCSPASFDATGCTEPDGGYVCN